MSSSYRAGKWQSSIRSRIGKTCPICGDSGWKLETDESGYDYASPCPCGYMAKNRMESRCAFAAIPSAYQGLRLYSFDLGIYRENRSREVAKAAFDIIRYWYADFQKMQKKGMGLYICSRSKGSGKTRMAASIAGELLMDQVVSVKFVTSLQILEAFKRSWDKNEVLRESDVFAELTETDVLVIDDFGVEITGNAWMKEKFVSILDSRYAGNKVTIFTSNYYPSELDYDERIIDRIRERSYRIVFPEESIRLQKEKKNMTELMERMNQFSKENVQMEIPKEFLEMERNG